MDSLMHPDAAPADAVLPEVHTLMENYFGAAAPEPMSVASDSAVERPSGIVTMEPKEAQDLRPGRKALFIANHQIVGEQG